MKLAMLYAGKGNRLKTITKGKPKQLLLVGKMSIYERHLSLANLLNAEPLVITNEKFISYFKRPYVEIVSYSKLKGVISTLFDVKGKFKKDFCWIAGDMVFYDCNQIISLVKTHYKNNNFTSFFYKNTNKFKAKLIKGDSLQIIIGRDNPYACSIPNFLIHSPKIFDYMKEENKDDFLQRAITAGERIYFEKYKSEVFEIDTPNDLNLANKYFKNEN
jgi:choline kinase